MRRPPPDLAGIIERTVDAAPPLAPEQLDRLSALLRPVEPDRVDLLQMSPHTAA